MHFYELRAVVHEHDEAIGDQAASPPPETTLLRLFARFGRLLSGRGLFSIRSGKLSACDSWTASNGADGTRREPVVRMASSCNPRGAGWAEVAHLSSLSGGFGLLGGLRRPHPGTDLG